MRYFREYPALKVNALLGFLLALIFTGMSSRSNLSALSSDGVESVADLTQDGRVNLLDWSSWQQNWQNPVSLSGDLNGDGIVDPDDLPLLFSDWLWRNPLQPIGHWKLDDAFGNGALNSSSNDNSDQMTGDPTWTDDHFEGGLQFAGTDDAVQIPVPGMNASGGAISLWCNADGFS